jgi:hypothetical protein
LESIGDSNAVRRALSEQTSTARSLGKSKTTSLERITRIHHQLLELDLCFLSTKCKEPICHGAEPKGREHSRVSFLLTFLYFFPCQTAPLQILK